MEVCTTQAKEQSRCGKIGFGHTYDEARTIIGLTKTSLTPSTSTQHVILSPAQARTVYFLELHGPISTTQKVLIVADLQTVPELY